MYAPDRLKNLPVQSAFGKSFSSDTPGLPHQLHTTEIIQGNQLMAYTPPQPFRVEEADTKRSTALAPLIILHYGWWIFRTRIYVVIILKISPRRYTSEYPSTNTSYVLKSSSLPQKRIGLLSSRKNSRLFSLPLTLYFAASKTVSDNSRLGASHDDLGFSITIVGSNSGKCLWA
jgi:hypothetical protein